jgi:hypothetical protein
VLLTRPPLTRIAPCAFDLHVLGTPPAFILSQDQTRHPIYMQIPSKRFTLHVGDKLIKIIDWLIILLCPYHSSVVQVHT